MMPIKYSGCNIDVYGWTWEEAFFLINGALLRNASAWQKNITITRDDGETKTLTVEITTT